MRKSLVEPLDHRASGEDRRRSQRVTIRCAVTLEMVIMGHKITVHAATVSVNDHGAMLLCSRSVAVNATFELQNDRTQEKQVCRVVRTPVERSDGYLIPVEFIQPAPNFWGISFPPANAKLPDN